MACPLTKPCLIFTVRILDTILYKGEGVRAEAGVGAALSYIRLKHTFVLTTCLQNWPSTPPHGVTTPPGQPSYLSILPTSWDGSSNTPQSLPVSQ